MIDLQTLSPWLLVVAPVAVIAGYTVFGLIGFGATAITVPILAHFLPISYLVPVMALLDVFSAGFVGHANREHVSKDELKRLVPWMFVGFVLGATVLVGVPDKFLRAALGAFATAIGIYGIVNPALRRAVSARRAVPAGIVGGAVATVFGAGGPIYAAYMSGRLADSNQVRSTIATLISISAFSRAVVYAVSGLLLHVAVFLGILVLAPFVWAGLAIARRIHTGLTQQQMRRVVGVVLVFMGLSFLVRALA